MREQAPPSFDEWVEYCFTQGYADFRSADIEDEAYVAREERFLGLDPVLLAGYIVRLFRAPSFIADRYTDEQIGQATWFLFGVASEYFSELIAAGIPQDLQVECITSMATLYTDLFDRVCGRRGEDPDTDYCNALEVDGAVYMIWDMGSHVGAIMFPEKTEYLVQPGFDVLDAVLTRCRTSSCLISALHGLGHLKHYHPQRVEQVIDRFLATRRPPAWVREYATQARTGYIQ